MLNQELAQSASNNATHPEKTATQKDQGTRFWCRVRIRSILLAGVEPEICVGLTVRAVRGRQLEDGVVLSEVPNGESDACSAVANGSDVIGPELCSPRSCAASCVADVADRLVEAAALESETDNVPDKRGQATGNGAVAVLRERERTRAGYLLVLVWERAINVVSSEIRGKRVRERANAADQQD